MTTPNNSIHTGVTTIRTFNASVQRQAQQRVLHQSRSSYVRSPWASPQRLISRVGAIIKRNQGSEASPLVNSPASEHVLRRGYKAFPTRPHTARAMVVRPSKRRSAAEQKTEPLLASTARSKAAGLVDSHAVSHPGLIHETPTVVSGKLTSLEHPSATFLKLSQHAAGPTTQPESKQATSSARHALPDANHTASTDTPSARPEQHSAEWTNAPPWSPPPVPAMPKDLLGSLDNSAAERSFVLEHGARRRHRRPCTVGSQSFSVGGSGLVSGRSSVVSFGERSSVLSSLDEDPFEGMDIANRGRSVWNLSAVNFRENSFMLPPRAVPSHRFTSVTSLGSPMSADDRSTHGSVDELRVSSATATESPPLSPPGDRSSVNSIGSPLTEHRKQHTSISLIESDTEGSGPSSACGISVTVGRTNTTKMAPPPAVPEAELDEPPVLAAPSIQHVLMNRLDHMHRYIFTLKTTLGQCRRGYSFFSRMYRDLLQHSEGVLVERLREYEDRIRVLIQGVEKAALREQDSLVTQQELRAELRLSEDARRKLLQVHQKEIVGLRHELVSVSKDRAQTLAALRDRENEVASMQAANESLRERCDKLEEEARGLRVEVADQQRVLTNHKEESEEKLESFRTRLIERAGKIRELNGIVCQQQIAIQKAQAAHREMEHKMGLLKESRANLQRELAETRDLLKSTEARAEGAMSRNSEAELRMRRMESDIASLMQKQHTETEERTEMTQELQESQALCHDLQEQIRSMNQAAEGAQLEHRAEIGRWKTRCDELEERLKDTRGELAATSQRLTAENEDLKTKNMQIAKLASEKLEENKSLRNGMTAAKAKVDGLQKTIEQQSHRLQASIQQKSLLLKDMNKLEDSYMSLVEKVKSPGFQANLLADMPTDSSPPQSPSSQAGATPRSLQTGEAPSGSLLEAHDRLQHATADDLLHSSDSAPSVQVEVSSGEQTPETALVSPRESYVANLTHAVPDFSNVLSTPGLRDQDVLDPKTGLLMDPKTGLLLSSPPQNK